MQKTYNFEFYNNKPSGGNFNLYGDITRSNNVFTSGMDELMNKAFTMTGGTSYSKLLLINLDDFMKMKSLQVGETMYDIRFTPISYLQYMQLTDVNLKVMEMPVASETEMVNLLKKYAPVYIGGMVMGKEDILNLYTKPYGFKCVEKSSLSDDMHGGLVFVSVYPSGETINGLVNLNNWKCERINSGSGVTLTNSAASAMTVYITSIGEGTYR